MTAILLLDTSSSMTTAIGSRRRIDVLADVLSSVLSTNPSVRLFSFNSTITELIEPATNLPEPGGSTALHRAIDYVASLQPALLIVISDGEPDDARAALAAAGNLNCVIETFYCGDETNRAAIGFLRDLALCSRGGVGRLKIADLTKPKLLADDIRLLLAGPVL
jgi:hypothetical protein